MDFSPARYLFLLSITLGTLDVINSQLAAVANKLPQIVSLLENVTETSTSLSDFLPHLENLLKTQEDVQIVTNHLLTNSTATADEVSSILPVIERFLQDMLRNQQNNHNQTQSTLTQMANNFGQVVDLLQNISEQLSVQNTLLVKSACTNSVPQATPSAVPQTTPSAVPQTTPSAVPQTTSSTVPQTPPNGTPVTPSAESLQTSGCIPPNSTLPSETFQSHGTCTLALLMENSPSDCSDVAALGCTISQPYTITPPNGNASVTVFCDLNTDGGNWTVFQRRFNGAIDFYRKWDDYEQGFGCVNSEYWAGLKTIHELTQTGSWILQINLEDFSSNTGYAEYRLFHVGSSTSNYQLSIGQYSGTIRDSLSYHNQRPFSTWDRDNDALSSNCAAIYSGAWWYGACIHSNLNGLYLGPAYAEITQPEGMTWYGWPATGQWYSLKSSEMKIRRDL